MSKSQKPTYHESQAYSSIQKKSPTTREVLKNSNDSSRDMPLQKQHFLTAGNLNYTPAHFRHKELKTTLGKFSRKTKEKIDENGVPGPGSYAPFLPRYRSNVSWSIGRSRRPHQEKNMDNPTPSTYNPKYNLTKNSSKEWSFGYEKQRPDTVKNINVHGKNPETDIQKLQTIHNSFEYEQVGPHTYYPEKNIKKIRKTPFHRDERKPLHFVTGTDLMIGPGAYKDDTKTLKKSLKDSLGLTMLAMTKKVNSKKLYPGPGMYDTIRENNNATKFTLSRGIRGDFTQNTLKNRCDWTKLIDATPGPGEYEVNSSFNGWENPKRYGMMNSSFDDYKGTYQDGYRTGPVR